MNSDVLLPAAFLAGLFGGAHCIGMCGAVVILYEQQGSRVGSWRRRLSYNIGRLGFYALLGAVAGAGGAVLTKISGINTGLFILRFLAGALVIAIGLNLLFNWSATRFLEQAGAKIWQRLSPLAKHVLPVATSGRALGAGFLWGALPCGLVYSAVALAATSGSTAGGAAVMLAFWCGTLPALLFAGASAAKLSQLKSNANFRRIAGMIMIGIGMFAMLPIARSIVSGT